MSFFARASWPGDHRDEIVAGALVAAVIVVLGYASGIGAPAPTTIDTAAPPAAGPPSPGPTEGPASGDSGSSGGVGGGFSDTSYGSWAGGDEPGIPEVGGTSGGTGGYGGGDGDGGTTPAPSDSTPASPSPTPSPSPSPSPSGSPGSCRPGDVHLVQPLLHGVVDPVTGLLDGLLGAGSPDSPTPTPTPTPVPSASAAAVPPLCVGIAPSPSLLPQVLPEVSP